jgi:hypothetical protein
MSDSADIAAKLHALADQIARADVAKDWVDAWQSNDAATADRAAMIAGCVSPGRIEKAACFTHCRALEACRSFD